MKALILSAFWITCIAGTAEAGPLQSSHHPGGGGGTSADHGRLDMGVSHYPDGHSSIYTGEHSRAGDSAHSASGPQVPFHSSGHGGHGYANSRHDHHPYRTLGR